MKKGTRDTVLGLVFFGGLGLILWATQKVSGFTLKQQQVILVEFSNARGLRTGEPVFVLGTQLGKVSDVDIDPQGPGKFVIKARLQLDRPVALTETSKIRVVDASMLGGKRVEITPGTSGEPVGEDHAFHGVAPLGPLDALAALVEGDENKSNLQGALKGIRDFMEKLNAGKGTFARLIEDDTLIKDAEAFVASLKRSATELEKKQGLLGKMIYDQELGRRADAILADLEKATKNLNTTEGPLGKILNDKDLAKRIDKIVDDVAQVTTKLRGKESLAGRIINDDELGKRVDGIVASLEKTAASLNDKDAGPAGALINDKDLLADIRKFVRDLSDVSDKINTGQGALGRLINDEDMGRRLDSVIRQVTRAIEDAREAAPIGTFFQVFSGAF